MLYCPNLPAYCKAEAQYQQNSLVHSNGLECISVLEFSRMVAYRARSWCIYIDVAGVVEKSYQC